MNLMVKLSSRKFLLAAAAFLASLGTGITGIATDDTALTTAGLVCTMLSAAIYAACEAYVDGKSAASNMTVTNKQVTATSTDKETVQAALAPASPDAPAKEA